MLGGRLPSLLVALWRGGAVPPLRAPFILLMAGSCCTVAAAAAAFLLNDHHDQHERPPQPQEPRQEDPRAAAERLAMRTLLVARILSPTRRQQKQRGGMTLCEGAKNAAVRHDDIDDNDETLHQEEWELMIVPDRGKLHSHVIFGTLLAAEGQQEDPTNDLIERYEVYRCTTGTTGTTSSTTRVRAVVELGGKLNGHPGVIHDGILAMLIDDVLGFGFRAAGINMAMTANLNINYLSPVPANSTILIDAHLVRREGRKLYWKVVVTNNNAAAADDPPGSTTVVYCNATSLYIIPRQHA
jgi:acyl-coenzyme A thioesterase PaaI-like protein